MSNNNTTEDAAVKKAKTEGAVPSAVKQEAEVVVKALNERLDTHDSNRKEVQEKLYNICEKWRKEIDDLEDKINSELEAKFKEEDSRLQTALNDLQTTTISAEETKLAEALQKAKNELLVVQRHSLNERKTKHTENEENSEKKKEGWRLLHFLRHQQPSVGCAQKEMCEKLSERLEMKTKKEVASEWFDCSKPRDLKVNKIGNTGRVFLSFTRNNEQERVFAENGFGEKITYKALLQKKGGEDSGKEHSLRKEERNRFSFVPDFLEAKTTYTVKVKADLQGKESEWSEEAEFTTPEFSEYSESVWKECPDNVDDKRKYSVNETNPRTATKINDSGYCCTVIGNTPLPHSKVTSWNIKILESKHNKRGGIYIGVAPSDINQNEDNYFKCGWYIHCYNSTLYSGPPHSYNYKEYGPRKGYGQYVHTGDSVGVVINTTKGEISFVVNSVNLGVAFDGIPLDKPLVPCILLINEDDSVELDTSRVKENVNRSIPIPSNITAKSEITWDTIKLTWDAVEGALFYQIEVDGSKFWDASTTNIFTKSGLQPDTEHSFRVRAVCGNEVSEWSDAVKGRTQKESFETSGWKECPDYVDEKKKYSVDEKNPRIVTKINGIYGYCTIIGNTPLPPNKVTSWSIKILKSRRNNGGGINVGVAPSNINQNEDKNYFKCGWYSDCYDSTLCSGPPHNKYWNKEYGPRKEEEKYVSVGVVMDTAKGELSFVVNGVNFGVAYEGIPLDKPLVPCVLLEYKGDSVELDTSEVKENVNSSIPVPSNTTAKSITWDSITLSWDAVEGASFYQIEVDGSKLWDASTTNIFTKRGLLADTEHSFRVRTVCGNYLSKWSDAVKGRTQKALFERSQWKECTEDVDYWGMKYSIDGKNPKIATKTYGSYWCRFIGNTPLPHNKVTSWSIKILKSKDNDGRSIHIGAAPFDINQNEGGNYNKFGWYFSCYYSTLYSGPPHNYRGKEYGPRKGDGEYVHTGDSIGIVMDTVKGELSFVVNSVNLGVAYDGIPLDKPLVPCVILWYGGDSVELII